jgi:outer membrane protein OmpA-like peptidoglycan-associated protein
MKRCKLYSRTALLSGALVVLMMSGCATVQENPMVTSARETFAQVQSDPEVNKLAPLELQEAKEAIAKTEASVASGADQAEVEHLAYMAKQKALIAGQVTTTKIADQEMETASAERNKILLSARTREAEHSYSQAELARQDAEAQRRAAEEALKEAQLRSAEAEKARMEAAEAEARTQKLQAQLADLEAKQTERGLVLTLGDVLFDTGKSELKEGAYSVIEKMAAFMKEYPARKVQIEGFTDSVGSDDYNLGLSIRRAESVRNALSGRGVELDRIMSRGYGEGFPVASNDTREGRQRNRRVEIVISDEKGMITERTR